MKAFGIGCLVFIFISSSILPGVPGRVSAAGSDYLVFTKPLFDFVLPTATPATGEITSTIKLSAAPDEYEPATFVVRATQKDLTAVTVTAGDLKKGTQTIPKQHIDIRVVKVWKQAGLDLKIDTPTGVLVPELLLYNDADQLTGGLKPDGSYTPPTISTTLRTNIPKDTSKQFWVTVYIPPATPAGKYTGSLTVSASNAAPQQITLEATVLPISLKSPRQKYAIYYNQKPSMVNLEKELTDIKNHGFEGFLLPSSEPEIITSILRIAQRLDFKGPMITIFSTGYGNIPLFRQFGFEPYVYGLDEPNIYNAETAAHSLRHHIFKSYGIHQNGYKVTTAILKQTSDALDNPQSSAYDQINPTTGKTFREENIIHESLDLANYYAHSLHFDNMSVAGPLWNYIQNLRRGAVSKAAKTELYYWQIWVEKPILNRMMAGYFLWTSKLDGIMPYVYQSFIRYNLGRDPFDDFDTAPEGNNYRDFMTTYPSAQGPIPTTQWEALREGYDDVRYLTAFYDLLPALRAKNSQLADSLAQEIKTELVRYNNPQDYKILSGADFGKTRQIVIRDILAAQQAIGPTPTPTSSPLPGDIDGNGKVDIFDYNLLITDFGKTTSSPADLDKNGKVDIFDYNILVGNFGKSN